MTNEEYKLVESLKEKIEEQDEMLKAMLSAPKSMGVVVRVSNGRAVFIDKGGSLMEGHIPPGATIRVGSTVKVDLATGGIVEVDVGTPLIGNLATLTKMVNDKYAEIETEAGRKMVLISWNVKGLKVGHRVVLDSTSSIITHTLGAANEGFKAPKVDPVSWDDIGGLAEAKRALREAIELPVKNARIFERYGRKPVKGIMLYGPPGCGKTLLAKASVTAIARLHGASSIGTGFIYIKGPEILSKWVGESESIVRSIFHRAREHYQDNGYPAVVFLDEADAILAKRGSGMNSSAGHMASTIVPQFLSEMDGLSGEGQPLVLIATNRPDTLDSAVVRDGRVDRKIRVERPGAKEVEEIFKINLKKRPSKDPELAQYAAKELMCDSKVIAQVIDTKGNKHNMTLAAAVNGAMVAGIVDRATELAMRRELDKGDASGLTKADMAQGVVENVKQMYDIDISDEVMHFAEMNKINVHDYVRVA